MKKVLQLALGILTSVGGFFEISNLVTGMQAGASFRFQLLWSLLLGTIMVIILVEMSGRYAAVTKKALPEAVREHLGFKMWLIPFAVLVLLHIMTLAAEIGGVAFAVQLLTGIPLRVWALPVAILIWLMLWRITFDAVEYSSALLGMLTLCFVVAALMYHPPRGEMLAGLLPSLPRKDAPRYWYVAVSIIGAILSPYLFYFYSSGAIEDKWDRTYIWINRGVSVIGMGFGAVISAGAIIVAAMVFEPRGIRVDSVNQAALSLIEVFPFWGFVLFAASLGIACTGAAVEVALSLSYMTAQTFGWQWGENKKPFDNARFASVYTFALFGCGLVMILGIDPLRLTLLSVAADAAVLPIVSIPFLLLMNDKRVLRQHANGLIGNVLVIAIILITLVMAVVSIPLLIIGG